MNYKILCNFFEKLKITYLHSKIELNYNSDFQLLIAVILSAQTTDYAVNKVTKKLFINYGTPELLMNLGEEKLRKEIRSLGLYNIKSRNIIKTCAMIVNDFNKNIPNNLVDLQKLPGVGRKTANIILNEIFKYKTIAVDTHVFRVSNRTGIAIGKTPFEVEQRLINIIPKQYLEKAHIWLLMLGRYICKANKPECFNCHVYNFCEYQHKNKN